MMLEGVCCRRTVQRRIKRAVQLGYWKRMRDANSWTDCPKCGKPRVTRKCEACQYRGRSKDDSGNWTGEFMRVPVYEFDLQKFRSAQRCREIHHFDHRTYQEHKAAAKRGEHPNVTEMPRKPDPTPPPKSPAPARREEPLRKTAQHQRESARNQKLSKTQAEKFWENLQQLKRGRTSYYSRGDGLTIALHPGENGYAPPMGTKAAFDAACAQWGRDPAVVRDALKFWGYALQLEE